MTRSCHRPTVAVLVLLCSLTVLGTSSALAAFPAWSEGGASTTKFEGHPAGSGIRFTLENGNTWVFSDGTGALITGETTGEKSVTNVTLKLTNGRNSCETGPNYREMIWTNLKGKLGYINKAKREVGLLLEPAAGQPIAKCVAEIGGKKEYKGTIVARITPVNVRATKYELHWENEYNKQRGLEGETLSPLILGDPMRGFQLSGMEGGPSLTFLEREVEIVA
jgi:hypothetical protein